jgi:myo-inositol-1(or 4)-monophosphatase
MPSELERELETAIVAARRAGAIQRQYLERGVEARIKNSPIDLVTEADKASEAAIIPLLAQAFPHHRILSEEGGGNHTESEWVWIVDPLDGTTNFAHGYPHFAVSIALQRNGATVVAVVYDAMQDELFTARQGAGAHCNGRPIRVSTTPGLERSLLTSGFPYDRQTNARNNVDHFADLLMRSHSVLHSGSAALDLAYVACGRLDGYWEFKLSPWDYAAGWLLVLEAGGRVTGPEGEPVDMQKGDIVTTNGHIHAELLACLQPAM